MKKILENKDLNELVKKNMQNIGTVCKELVPEGWGFIFMTYPHGSSKGELIYVSNSNREDVVKALEEFIEKTKNNFGNDTEKYGVKDEQF